MIRGQFVVTFPFHGGWSRERIKRAAFPEFVDAAVRAGVTLTGPPRYRLEPAAHGWFLVVEAPGNTHRPASEVRAAAEYMAYEHRAACPHISTWIDQHLQEAAA